MRCRCDSCREAEKLYQHEYRVRNGDRLREYDRQPERSTALRDDPEKRRARQAAADGIRKRGVTHPCEECGAAEAQMHHADYARPLEVTWLCPPCHGRAHRKTC